MWSWNEIYSDDWTHGIFDTKEEAIKDALDCFDYLNEAGRTYDTTIKIGECEITPLRTDVDPDHVMEYLDQLYCDETGCDYYIYEGVTDEERKWLGDKLSELMNEFHNMIGLSSNWFHMVTEETIDLSGYREGVVV